VIPESLQQIPFAVPSVREIQRILDAIGIAQHDSLLDVALTGRQSNATRYFGSSRWIGSSEVSAVLHATLPTIGRCKIRYFSAENSQQAVGVTYQSKLIELFEAHFGEAGPASPVMCGGASGAALTILGITTNKPRRRALDESAGCPEQVEAFVLVLDPHWTVSSSALERRPTWRPLEEVFPPGRYFNLCLPYVLTETAGAHIEAAATFDKEKVIVRLEAEAEAVKALATTHGGGTAQQQWEFEVVDSGHDM
jgi:hypothetical protein